MSTVVIRLAAPMQSWGHQPRGSKIRPTNDHPTKSGVVGVIANALGRNRSDDITDLAALRFAVRADRLGYLETDFHTAGSGDYPLLPGDVFENPKLRAAAKTKDPNGPGFPFKYAPGKDFTVSVEGEPVAGGRGNTSITRVGYIADAVFTAALTGPNALIDQIAAALRAPARTLFLGRAAYRPTESLLAGIDDSDDTPGVLAQWEPHQHADAGPWHLWIEVPPMTPDSLIVDDQPVNFSSRERGGRAELHTTIVTAAADHNDEVDDLLNQLRREATGDDFFSE